MKKIGLIVKEASESRIKDNLKSASAFFIIKYSGLSSPDLTSLRQSLKGAGANMFVAKNNVARRAFKASGLESVIQAIEGPCGLVFVKEEPVAVTKVLCTFSKDHDKLKLEAGYLEDKVLTQKDIETLAKLPSKEALRAMVVCALNAPILKFAMVLNQTLKKFVYCLDQIKQKKAS